MTKEQQQQREFSIKFGVTVYDKPTIPLLLDKKLAYNLIKEELQEFFDAMYANDFVDVADSLGDLLYVVHQAANIWGIDLEPVFPEIHRSNMTKFWPDGTVHRRPEDGKVLKPATYSPPNLGPIIEAQILNKINI